MITILKNGKTYGINHFVADNKDDLKLLNSDLLTMGSTVYIISTGETFIVNSDKEWVTASSSSGGEISIITWEDDD